MTNDELNALIVACEELIDTGKGEIALEKLELVSEISPNEYLPWYAMSSIHFKSGDYERACVCSKKALIAFNNN